MPAGGTFARTIIQDSGAIHQLDIAIGKGANVAAAGIDSIAIGTGAYAVMLLALKAVTPAEIRRALRRQPRAKTAAAETGSDLS